MLRPTSLMYLAVWLFACNEQGSGPLGNTSSPCSADEFRGPGGSCEALTVCGSDEFESAPPSGRIDRRCEAVTICKATQYEARAPTPTSDRDCRRLKTCTAFEFEARAPTPTHDRDCARYTTCDADEYELTAATATSDRVCMELTECETDEHEVKRPTETSDRGCAPNTDGGCPTGQYMATSGPVRQCMPATVCRDDEYEVSPPTQMADRVCRRISQCGQDYYEFVAPTATSDRACKQKTPCTAKQYESDPGTATSDRVCTAWIECTSGEYETVLPTPTRDRVCAALTECTSGEYESRRPAPTSDRVCAALTECTSDAYQSVPPTATSDRVCAALTECTSDEYQSVPPTPTSDRKCTELTECTSDEYQSVPPTPTSDRTCTALMVCLETEEEVVPPTPTTDRVCRDRCFEVTCTPSNTCNNSECNSFTGQCEETNAGNCVGCPDLDHDGWGLGCVGVLDCDDERFNVNPGRTEVCGNGLDDDCDSETSDVDCEANPCPLGGCGPGCADETREGYTDALLYPGIAACSGGWSVPGVFQEHLPTCDHLAGNDSANPAGTDCTASDLCAPGWHVCRTALEVLTFSEGAGCEPATVAETFFVTGQSGNGCAFCSVSSDPADNGCSGGSCNSTCYPTSVQSNDIFGCGAIGATPAENCTPLNAFGHNLCNSLPSPWACSSGSNTNDEALWVTKSGSAAGGVLCCVD